MTRSVKVRICVAIAESGKEWCASGWSDAETDEEMREQAEFELRAAQRENVAFRWVTADIPLPEELEVEGEVE